MEYLTFLAGGGAASGDNLAVVPVLVGPLSALMAMLPAILVALGGIIVSITKPTTVKRMLLLMWAQKVVLIGIGAVIGAMWWGGTRLFGGLREVAAAEAGATEWSVWRGSPARTAYVPTDLDDPANGTINWSYVDGKIVSFYSSPAVVGNRVYATSALPGYFSEKGGIYSLDADTGKEVWAFRAGGYRATFSSPVVSGRHLVVGEGLHFTTDARVFCIDVQESEKRREAVKLWDYRTKSHVESSPCIYNGRAYVGAGDDGMYCFNLEPGPDGKVVHWHLEGERYPDCESSPVAHEGKVYFGLGLGGNALVCVDAVTGKEEWRVDTPYPVFGSPSIAQGKIFVGMGHGNFVFTAEQVAANLREKLRAEGKSKEEIEAVASKIFSIGEVWAIDLETHAKAWSYKVGTTVLGAVAVDGESLYFGTRDGKIFSLTTADGKLRRSIDVHTPIVSSPAVGRELVYVVTQTGQLFGLDKERLTTVWQVPLHAPMNFSSPVVARGHVYVGTSTSGLVCLGQPGRQQVAAVWKGHLGGPGGSGWQDGSLLAKGSSYGWDHAEPIPGEAAEGKSTTTSPVTPLGARLYVGRSQGERHGLMCLVTDADGVKRKPAVGWFAPSKNRVLLGPAATEGAVYFVDGKAGDSDRALRCLDPASGAERWRRPVSAEADGEFFITADRLYVADRPRGLTCLDLKAANPVELWQAEVGQVVGMPCTGPDLIFVAVADEAALLGLDAFTGLTVWRQPLASPPTTGPIWLDGYVWAGHAGGLAACPLVQAPDPEKKTAMDAEKTAEAKAAPLRPQVLTAKAGAIAGRLVVGEERVFAVAADGALLAARKVLPAPTDPNAVPGPALELTRLGQVKDGLPPLVAGASLLYVAEGSIQRYDFATATSESWAPIRPQWPGLVTTPMVMTDSHVLFATDKRGLVCMRPKN